MLVKIRNLHKDTVYCSKPEGWTILGMGTQRRWREMTVSNVLLGLYRQHHPRLPLPRPSPKAAKLPLSLPNQLKNNTARPTELME